MANGPKTFLLVGSSQYSNRGCEAIIRGTVEILSRRFPGSRFLISGSREEDIIDGRAEKDSRIEHRPPRAQFKYDTLSRYFYPQWWLYRVILRPFPRLTCQYIYKEQLKAMSEAACAFEVGGDNYTLLDYGSPEYLIPLDQTLLSTGKPLILWGASVGTFTADPRVERRMTDHLKRFTLILARETETVSYLESLGVTDNVKLVADPAFLMAPVEPILSDTLKDFIEQSPIGINLSAFAGKFITSLSQDDWKKIAKDCIRALLEADLGPILLVPHVFKETNDDHKFLEEISREINARGEKLAILPKTLSAAELKWVISKLQAFAGARTHSTIAALSSSVPTISIGYSMKARGINKDIFKHLDWLLPVSELNTETLLGKMRKLLSCKEAVREHLDNTIPEIQKKSLLAGDYVAEVLEANIAPLK